MSIPSIVRQALRRLARLPRSHGFGVQSPFAFDLIRDVVRNPLPYYAYDQLPQPAGRRELKRLRLLFRLANFVQPELIVGPALTAQEKAYLQAACPRARMTDTVQPACDGKQLLVIPPGCQDTDVRSWFETSADGSLLVVQQPEADAWNRLLALPRATVAFHLDDIGLIFRHSTYHPCQYKINY